MPTLETIRRVAIAMGSAFALLAPVAWQTAVAQSRFPIRNVQVDVAPLRIDYLTLGARKHDWAWDNISGVAMIGGVQRPLRAATRYQVSAIDQTLVEESNRRRVTQLLQALSYWLARDL
jgi:hypothetical protein